MGGIIPRTSLLNLGVQDFPRTQLPMYLACDESSYASNHGNSHELLLGFASSSLRGFHRHDGGEPVHRKGVSSHMLHMYGFAFLRF